ncbi:LLM class flavin-dependent oxidoreductase [Amycolatopsis jejuensis]|uniref:LLM class flavin-dependent oxidoreductase n=1 Tax=Amycolatopsis jejuensis TaxID=330084 RepID=UPI0005267111|nr:LLM class flavin-dependent oxidoreductase [Amycolatopsis jejuensis]
MPEISFVYPYRLPWPEVRPLLSTLDESGAHGLWVYENPRERGAFAVAGAVLGATSRLTVGVGVVTTYVRHPEVLAMETLQAGCIGPGRFVLGLGAGSATEAARLGVEQRSPLGTVRAQIDAVRSFESAAPPAEPIPEPPILIGATGPKMIATAGAYADGLVLSLNAPPAFVRRAATVAREAARAAGRARPWVVVYVHAVVADSHEAALEVARAQLGTTLGRLAGNPVFDTFAGDLPSPLGDELREAARAGGVDPLSSGLVRELACVGTAEDLVARARQAYADADEVVLLVPGADAGVLGGLAGSI